MLTLFSPFLSLLFDLAIVVAGLFLGILFVLLSYTLVAVCVWLPFALVVGALRKLWGRER